MSERRELRVLVDDLGIPESPRWYDGRLWFSNYGICLDAQGAVWHADVPNQRAVRVDEGGSVLDSIELDRGGFACMLAGDDRQTLCIAAAVWTTPEEIENHIANRTGRIYATGVEIPGVGWP